jgi:hypothetical protein
MDALFVERFYEICNLIGEEEFKALFASVASMPASRTLNFIGDTYTTQADAERDNRNCEFPLREVELLAAVAHFARGASCPAAGT